MIKTIIVFAIGIAIVFVIVSMNKSNLNEKSKNDSLIPITESVTPTSSISSITPTVAEKKNLEKPAMQIKQSKNYQAILKTSEGDITVVLSVKETPVTVNNFVYLTRNNFYNNTIFHRIIKDFMIQGGDPEGTGRGGPGYRFNDEPFTGEYTRGTIAMANAGPNTNGSQFFIMHKDNSLPKNYVIFGQVVQGIEVVDKIAEAQVGLSDSGEMSKPKNPIQLKSVEIVEE